MAYSPERPFSWGRFSPAFLDELAARVAGLRVLETFAGNGLLAAGLVTRGVDVLATSRLSGEDGHEFGVHHPVLELDAVASVLEHGHARDLLLMSWPPADAAAARCAAAWGPGRPLAFVGEVTHPGRNLLGGCATDELFAMLGDVEPFASYVGRNVMDIAFTATVRFPGEDGPRGVDWEVFRPGAGPG